MGEVQTDSHERKLMMEKHILRASLDYLEWGTDGVSLIQSDLTEMALNKIIKSCPNLILDLESLQAQIERMTPLSGSNLSSEQAKKVVQEIQRRNNPEGSSAIIQTELASKIEDAVIKVFKQRSRDGETATLNAADTTNVIATLEKLIVEYRQKLGEYPQSTSDQRE